MEEPESSTFEKSLEEKKKNLSVGSVSAFHPSTAAHCECKAGLLCADLDLVEIPQHLHTFGVFGSDPLKTLCVHSASNNWEILNLFSGLNNKVGLHDWDR